VDRLKGAPTEADAPFMHRIGSLWCFGIACCRDSVLGNVTVISSSTASICRPGHRHVANGSELIHLWEIRLHDYGSIVAVHHIIFIIRDILVDRSVI
jgi:hypothetical protein